MYLLQNNDQRAENLVKLISEKYFDPLLNMAIKYLIIDSINNNF